MIRLSKKQREIYGEKSVEFSLISIAGLIIAQLTEGGLTQNLVVIGVSLAVTGVVTSHFFLKNLED